MAVNVSEDTVRIPESVQKQRTGDAPSPDLGDLFSSCSSQGGWSGEALEYLEIIKKTMEDPSRPIRAQMRYISDDAVAFNSEGSSVVLVRESDIINLQALAVDAKLFNAKEAFYKTFLSNKLINIVTVNRFMYNRASQMIGYLTQVFMARQNDAVKDFTIESFNNKYLVDVNTDMASVRQFFDTFSTSSVNCSDFGFVASLVDKSNTQRTPYTQPRPMFGVTGYVEFVRNDEGQFRPLVHITDILSVLASPKILAIALSTIAEVFINRQLWRHPFTAVGNSDINIGNLIIDATTNKPREVKTEIDFREMFRSYVIDPILCIDVRSGYASIPGLEKITRADGHDLLINEIYKFLDTTPIVGSIGENCFQEIIGVVETGKSGKFSNLMDSRDINYLNMVAKLKYNPKLDQLLMRGVLGPIQRFDMLRNDIIGGDITPTYSSITTILHGQFIRQIGNIVSSKIKVDIPIAGDMASINMTDFATRAYSPGTPMFGNVGPTGITGGGYLR